MILAKAVVTTDPYPEDIDTNSLAASIVKPIDSTAHALMDEMLTCANSDGIIQVMNLLYLHNCYIF